LKATSRKVVAATNSIEKSLLNKAKCKSFRPGLCMKWRGNKSFYNKEEYNNQIKKRSHGFMIA